MTEDNRMDGYVAEELVVTVNIMPLGTDTR